TERQTSSTLPGNFDGKSHCADLKITPDGRFLYGTNRGHDSIAAYRIGDDGRLTLIAIEPSLGKGPQNLAITPDGKWLLCANMPGDNVVVFRINPQIPGVNGRALLTLVTRRANPGEGTIPIQRRSGVGNRKQNVGLKSTIDRP